MIKKTMPSLATVCALALAAGLGGAFVARGQAQEFADQLRDGVSEAIREAVASKVGTDASVTVELLEVSGAAVSDRVDAVADADARLGQPIRFMLLAAGVDETLSRRQVGVARAIPHVVAPHVRANRAIARGSEIKEGDIESVVSETSGVRLRPLPRAADVLGGRALRDLAPHEIIQSSGVVLRPAIRSGEKVTARVQIAGAEVMGRVVAAQNGRVGAIIRVVNPDSRRELRARVVRAGLVEVIDGH